MSETARDEPGPDAAADATPVAAATGGGHPILSQEPTTGGDGFYHRMRCGCGHRIDAGPSPSATLAEADAFRLFADHAGGGPRPVPDDELPPLPPAAVWEAGVRRPRRRS